MAAAKELVSSFPIGEEDPGSSDDAPGTPPHPSAPSLPPQMLGDKAAALRHHRYSNSSSSSTAGEGQCQLTAAAAQHSTACRTLASHHPLLSFPVGQDGELDSAPASPRGGPASDDEQGGDDQLPSATPDAPHHSSASSRAPGDGSHVMRLVQQLAIGMPWPGWQQQQQHPGALLLLSRPASVTLTAMHSARHCWRAWGGALQDSLAGCRAAAQRVQAASGGGALACQCLATLLLGLLLYHAQQGLMLLPIAAASLALAASGSMAAAAAARAGGGGSSSSHSCLPVWPAQCAGAVFAAHCLVLALLRPLAAGLAARLLAGTPQVLALVLLLLAGQVVLGVLCAGWASTAELRHASLLCRCWFVAAVGVLLGACSTGSSVAGVLAAAAAWAQKGHMLLVEGPLLVMQLGALLQPSGTPARAAAEHSAAGASSSTALLCCLHCLLQLLVVLFVPPAPLAAAAWLPQLLQGLLVWSARVLLCGCCMQLALRCFRSSNDCGSAAALSAAEAPADGTGPSSSRRRRAAGVRQLRLTAAAAAASDRSCFDSCLSSPVGLNNSSLRQHSSGGDPSAPWLPLSPPLARYHRSPQQPHSGSPGMSSPSPVHCWDLRLANHDGDSNNEPATLSLFRQPPGGMLVVAPTEDVSSSSAAGACVAALAHAPAGRLLKQHAAYLLVLAAAFAGDSFITAAAAGGGGGGPAAVHGAAGAWAVRLAWHRVVRGALVAALGAELWCSVWREAVLWKALWGSRHTGWPGVVWQVQAQQQF